MRFKNFNPSVGFPAGEKLRYECGICGDMVLSMPTNAAACKCSNIIVDADAGRISVKDETRIKVYEIE